RGGELIALCSLLCPVVPESRVVLQNISLQPTPKVQEVRSDFLRSGNIAVLILVHAGGRLPSGSGSFRASLQPLKAVRACSRSVSAWPRTPVMAAWVAALANFPFAS